MSFHMNQESLLGQIKQLTGGFIRTGPEGDPRRNHAVRVARVGDLGDVGVVREHHPDSIHFGASVREGLLLGRDDHFSLIAVIGRRRFPIN